MKVVKGYQKETITDQKLSLVKSRRYPRSCRDIVHNISLGFPSFWIKDRSHLFVRLPFHLMLYSVSRNTVKQMKILIIIKKRNDQKPVYRGPTCEHPYLVSHERVSGVKVEFMCMELQCQTRKVKIYFYIGPRSTCSYASYLQTTHIFVPFLADTLISIVFEKFLHRDTTWNFLNLSVFIPLLVNSISLVSSFRYLRPRVLTEKGRLNEVENRGRTNRVQCIRNF